jgi:hypothetical protein
MDQTILEARIITQEFDFPGFPSLTRCAERLQVLQQSHRSKALVGDSSSSGSSGEAPPVTETTAPETTTAPAATATTAAPPINVYDAFAREILSYKLEMTKTCRHYSTCDIEASNYQSLTDEVSTEIAKVREEVLRLEVELKQQEGIRSHRERLELLAKEVNTRPARSSLKRKLAAMEEELKNVEESITAIDAAVMTRHEQFEALQRAVAVLQDVIGEFVVSSED